MQIFGSTTSGTTGGGGATIEGLPYACHTDNKRMTGSQFVTYGLNVDNTATTVIEGNLSTVTLLGLQDSANYATADFDAVANPTYAGFTITYFTT